MKIVQISFAYNNGQIIKLLKQRGNYIATGKYAKILKCEKKINELQEQNEIEKRENQFRPVSAFITWNT